MINRFAEALNQRPIIAPQMPKGRTDFTDAQRAAIYVRDRATCCFSGANLWLLESPLRPGYERDWADHVRPSARGGSTDEANGACASHTFNGKKRHNSADTAYLFQNGLPTWRYFDIFGRLTPEQDARLRRLARLELRDWYFNRAIGQILCGFDYRCRLEWYEEEPKRDDWYWFRAAYRKIVEFQAFDAGASLEDRMLVTTPSSAAVSWLALRQVESEQTFLTTIEAIYPQYRTNFLAWVPYFYDCVTNADRRRAIRHAEKAHGLSDDTLQCIRHDYALRTHNGE